MTKEEPPECLTCGVILTVKYLITECLKYEEDAKKYNIASNIDAAQHRGHLQHDQLPKKNRLA
jgi:hypothetical protein